MDSIKLAENRDYRMNYLYSTFMRLRKLDEERNGSGKRRNSEEDIAKIENSIRQEFELWLEWQGLEELKGESVAHVMNLVEWSD